MGDIQKLRDEMAALMAEGKRQLELKKAGQGALNADEFEKRMKKALDDQRQALMVEQRKGKWEPEEDPKTDERLEAILFEKSDRPEVREFHKFNDDVLMLASLTKQHPTQLKTYQKGIGRFKESKGNSELAKAMAGASAAQGAEWLPTEYSTDLYDRVRLEAQVAAQFAEIQMPTKSYELPTSDTDPTTTLEAENTSDTPTEYTKSTPSTGKVTLTAVKLTTHIVFSDELTEDSIIPVIEFIKNKMAKSMAYAYEDALLNGDTTATHMDSDVTGAKDARKAWNGLRKATQTANNVSLASPITLANIRSLRSKMGKYGVNPRNLVLFVSSKGFVKLLDLPEVVTVDKYGPNATVIQGELAKIDGISIVVSEKMRDSLNASGVNDSTNNEKSIALLVYTPGFVRGMRKGLVIRPWIDPRSGSQNLVQQWRGDFKPVYAVATEPIAVKGVNWVV